MHQAFSSLPSLLWDSFFESIWESYVTKNYCPASLRSIFSKISENLVYGDLPQEILITSRNMTSF